MKVIVTCGPGYEPIDEVRRLTNFSTGELGLRLSRTLAADGHEVICLKSDTCLSALDLPGIRVHEFTTNQSLSQLLEAEGAGGPVQAVFHAAALSDYKVERILDAEGREVRGDKLPSRLGRLTLELAPALKVIHNLRSWFPEARIVGWKYELEGTCAAACQRAQRQIDECDSQACVINGRAYGPGFGLYEPGKSVRHCDDKPSLCRLLGDWLSADERRS